MKRAIRAALASAAVLLGGACFAESTTLPGGGGSTGGSSGGSESNAESTGTPPGTDSGQTSTEDGGGDESTGAPSQCGNGVVDPDEECDGDAGCDSDCNLLNYVCNPFDQVGCAATQICDLTRGATLDDQNTGCFQIGSAQLGDPCQYDAIDPTLQCGAQWSCVGSSYVPSCDGSSAECCTELCIIGGAPCSDPQQQCLSWKEPTMPPGLDELGLCIHP